MPERPELIVFSQNLLGGGASFHRNMLSHFPDDFFDVRCIYLNPTSSGGAKALDMSINPNDQIFSFGNEPKTVTAKRMSALISDREGAIVANLADELISLDLYPKRKKTVFFICHDDGFVDVATKYETLIDVYITHNIAVYELLAKLMPGRQKDLHFIQHGVSIPAFEKVHNRDEKLRIVFLARHYEFKGLYDLPVIDELLRQRGIDVDWTILGDGPDRLNFIKRVENLSNFRLDIPKTSEAVLNVLKEQDIFILPSRKDGLPVALLESMSVGCVPVIANFSEGIKKVVTEQIGFVLPVGDNQAFADKIRTLSEDRGLLRTLSNNCIDKVKSEFDIRKQSLEYYNLYKNYKQLRKKHSVGLKDIYRRTEYYEFFNKLSHFGRVIKAKLTPEIK